MTKHPFLLIAAVLILLPKPSPAGEDLGTELQKTLPPGTKAQRAATHRINEVPPGNFSYTSLTAGVYEAELSDYPGHKCYYRLVVTQAVPNDDWVFNKPAHLVLMGPLKLPNKNWSNCPIYGHADGIDYATPPLQIYCDAKERGKLGKETLLDTDRAYLLEKGVDVDKIECWYSIPVTHPERNLFAFQRSETSFETFEVDSISNSLVGTRDVFKGGFCEDRPEVHRKVFTRISN